MKPAPASPPVISAAGRRATWIVGLLRLSSAICTGAALVAVSRLFTGGGGPSGVVALCCAAAAGLFAIAEIAYGGRAARAEERRVRATLLARRFGTPSLPAGASGSPDEVGPAAVIQLMGDNSERLTDFRQIYLGATLAALAIPFVTLTYIGVFIDPVVGFGVMAVVPLIPLLIRGFMRLFRKTSAASRNERALLSGRYLDALRNLVTIRLLGAGERIEHDLREQGEANRGAIMRLLAGNQIVIIVVDGLFSLLLICLTTGLAVSRADHLTDAEVLAVVLLTILLLEPLQQVAGFFYIGMGGIASQRAIRSFLSSTPPPVAPDSPTRSGTPELDTRRTDTAPDPDARSGTPEGIELRGVYFDYGRGEVLSGVDLSVAVGERVAIIGRSGAGKSTLLGLLSGSLPPQQGRIAVAGHQIDTEDPAATRALSATVAQSTWMFTGTIADNLLIARSDATDDQMWEALERAQVAEEIARMPRGLHTHLGEGAALVSGGQAQRISLARALLSGRRVLLLDEPTSQVDRESESRIIDAIAALPRDLTVLMITHRRSLLRVVDAVYELTGGRLNARETARA